MKLKIFGILFLFLALGFSTALAQKKQSGVKKTTGTTRAKVTPKTGSIELEAGLVFKSGDTKPVARNKFYLFREAAEKVILTQANLDAYNQDLGRRVSQTLDKWDVFSAVLYMDGTAPTFTVAAKKSVESAAVASTTTGFDGKAVFENVPVGDYYLFGYYSVGKQTVYWNLPVSVKPGRSKVVLDNENTG